jgi:hypothetical protein
MATAKKAKVTDPLLDIDASEECVWAAEQEARKLEFSARSGPVARLAILHGSISRWLQKVSEAVGANPWTFMHEKEQVPHIYARPANRSKRKRLLRDIDRAMERLAYIRSVIDGTYTEPLQVGVKVGGVVREVHDEDK